MAGVGKLLKQAQKMQKKMEAIQEELASREIEVSHGGGAIVITITGAQEFKSVKIDPEFLKEDPEDVEAALLEAVREASSKAKQAHEEAMGSVSDGMSIPGLM